MTRISSRLPSTGGGGGVTLPIAESDVTNLIADLAAKASKWNVQSKTSAYTAASGDFILADGTGGSFAVTSPAAAAGAIFAVKKVNATSANITVTPASGTIDGAPSAVVSGYNQIAIYISDGTNWKLASTRIATVNALAPTGVIAETIQRSRMLYSIISGYISGKAMGFAVELFAGQVVTGAAFATATTAAAGVNNIWFALAKLDGTRVAITADDGATGWAASTYKGLSFVTPYTVPVDGVYFLVVSVNATTMPTFIGTAGNSTLQGQSPVMNWNSGSGYTTPASAPSSFTIAGTGGNHIYGAAIGF